MLDDNAHSVLDDPDATVKSAESEKKKDKKLVFLSRSVLQSVREYP